LTDKHVDDSDGSCWERMIAVFSSMNRKYFFQLNKNFLDNFFNWNQRCFLEILHLFLGLENFSTN